MSSADGKGTAMPGCNTAINEGNVGDKSCKETKSEVGANLRRFLGVFIFYAFYSFS